MKRLLAALLGTSVLVTACGEGHVPAPVSASGDVASEAAQPSATEARPVDRSRPSASTSSSASSEVVRRPRERRVPEYREVMLPAGTVLPLRLTSSIASDRSQIEDVVSATLREDLVIDGGAVLPKGTKVVGRVTDVERSGRVKGRARVAFRFTLLRHDDDEYDMRTRSIERVAAATKGEDATKIGVGAGAGAAVGAILGGGSGAAKGAAIGAAAGTGAVLATRGEEVRLEAGEAVDTTLTAALPVRVRLN